MASGLTYLEVDEGVIGGTAGGLVAKDPDSGQTFTYQLTYNPGNSFRINGKLVQTAVALDYEKATSYQIRVKVTDSGSPPQSFQKYFTVKVNNVNEPPEKVILSPNQVRERERERERETDKERDRKTRRERGGGGGGEIQRDGERERERERDGERELEGADRGEKERGRE